MLVGVDQVAGLDLDPADHDRRAELDEPDIGVADAGVEAEELEPQGADLVEVARAAAGDVADAAELLVDRGGDLAELGTQARAGRRGPGRRRSSGRAGGDVAEVVAEQVGLGSPGSGGAARVLRGHRVADDRARGPAAGSGS